MKILKSLIVVLMFFGGMATTTFAQDAAEVATAAATTLETMEVKVKGIGCGSDIKTISANVKKLDGVKSCDLAKKGATTIFNISYNPAAIQAEAIHAAIEGTPGCKNPDSRPYKVKI